MTDSDFIIELFCWGDGLRVNVEKHPQASMYPSELVTLGLVFALKGSGTWAFYRWISRNFEALFPPLVERTRFFRDLKHQQHCLACFLAEPSMIGSIDSFGIELLHARRKDAVNKRLDAKVCRIDVGL